MGSVELSINNVENATNLMFYVVQSLPGNVDLLLGQNWLECHGSEFNNSLEKESQRESTTI